MPRYILRTIVETVIESDETDVKKVRTEILPRYLDRLEDETLVDDIRAAQDSAVLLDTTIRSGSEHMLIEG